MLTVTPVKPHLIRRSEQHREQVCRAKHLVRPVQMVHTKMERAKEFVKTFKMDISVVPTRQEVLMQHLIVKVAPPVPNMHQLAARPKNINVSKVPSMLMVLVLVMIVLLVNIKTKQAKQHVKISTLVIKVNFLAGPQLQVLLNKSHVLAINIVGRARPNVKTHRWDTKQLVAPAAASAIRNVPVSPHVLKVHSTLTVIFVIHVLPVNIKTKQPHQVVKMSIRVRRLQQRLVYPCHQAARNKLFAPKDNIKMITLYLMVRVPLISFVELF